jgi:hypothetical protein
MKEFTYTVMQSQIQLAFTVMCPAWGRMMDSADSGSWNIHEFISRFSSNFIGMVSFL